MILGISNFSKGVSQVKRISEAQVLSICSGFDTTMGHAVPINTPKELFPSAFTPNGNQIFVYTSPRKNVILAIDNAASPILWEKDLDAATGFVTTTEVVDMELDSVPVQLGEQVMFPCVDGIKVWEPSETGVGTVRLLSLKSPADYATPSGPSVVATSPDAVSLFDFDTDPWVVDSTSTSDPVVSGDTHTFTLKTGCTGRRIAYRPLTAGVSLSGKSWLILDVKLVGDAQLYTSQGMFINNVGMVPSGYSVRLHDTSDASGTAVASLLIPKLETDGAIHKILINVDGYDDTVLSVELYAENFCNPPSDDVSRTLTVYSTPAASFNSDLSGFGAYLLPAYSNDSSPLSENIAVAMPEADNAVVRNVLDNGGFETTGEWTFPSPTGTTGPAINMKVEGKWVKGFQPRTGALCAKIDTTLGRRNALTHIILTKQLVQNATYKLSFWIRQPWQYRHGDFASIPSFKYYVVVKSTGGTTKYLCFPDNPSTWTTVDPEAYDGVTHEPMLSMDYYVKVGSFDYQLQELTFTVPDTSTSIDITIGCDPFWGNGITAVDDVSLTLLNKHLSNSTFVIGTHTEDEPQIDGLPKVQYRYSFIGKSSTNPKNLYMMVSNPSDASTEYMVSSPWASYQVTANMPLNLVNADYGEYVTHIAFYRSIWDETLEVWGEYYLCGVHAINWTTPPASQAVTDTGALDFSFLYYNGTSIPYVMERNNDYAFPAAHVAMDNNRIYAGRLENIDDVWQRNTTLQISSYGKFNAFPTTTDSDSPPSDGGEVEGFASKSSVINAIYSMSGVKFLFGDREVYGITGDNSSDGWSVKPIDMVGCVTERLVSGCRTSVVWYDGNDFFASNGAEAQNISKTQLKSGALDTSYSCGATYVNNKYVAYGKYDGQWALLEFDFNLGSWLVHFDPGYQLTGIGATTDKLYGVSSTGQLMDIYGQLHSSDVRVICTPFIACGGPDADTTVRELLLEASLETGTCDVVVQVDTLGAVKTTSQRTIHVDATKSRYHTNINVDANSVKILASIQGAVCPDIMFIGFTFEGSVE